MVLGLAAAMARWHWQTADVGRFCGYILTCRSVEWYFLWPCHYLAFSLVFSFSASSSPIFLWTFPSRVCARLQSSNSPAWCSKHSSPPRSSRSRGLRRRCESRMRSHKLRDGTVILLFRINFSIPFTSTSFITPLWNRFLNRRSRIFLKMETLQPSGSFKSR